MSEPTAVPVPEVNRMAVDVVDALHQRIAQLEATIREKDEALVKAKHGLEAVGMGCGYIDAALAKEKP